MNVVKRILHGRVRQFEPLLHEVDPEHLLRAHGRAAVSGLGIVRLDEPGQLLPRDYLVHLGEELLFPGPLFLALVSQTGETDLLQGDLPG